MDTATLDELRELRARAYGPSPDIDQDPAALRRLHELEALRSGSAIAASGSGGAVAATVGDEPEPESVPASEPELELAPGTGVGSEGDRRPAEPDTQSTTARRTLSARARRRWIGLWWVLSVVASAALAAGATYALTSMAPVSVSSGAEQIATLEPVPMGDLPSGWMGVGPSSVAYEFFGFTLFESTMGMFGSGTDCLTIVPTDQLPEEDADPNNWSMSGQTYSSCSVGDFATTVEVPVDSSSPKELTDRYPIGSALQFALDGDRVGVFLDSE